MDNRLLVGITHGDVNGIGYELIIKMMAENKMCEVCKIGRASCRERV